MDNMNEMNNVMDSVEMNNAPVVTTDATGAPASTGISLKTAGLAGLAAVVVGAVAYYGYKKYKDRNQCCGDSCENHDCK